MDDLQLIKRWQETILLHSRQNKESTLTELLCDTIELFKVRPTCGVSDVSQSSWYQINNWLMHQFVIKLSQTDISSFTGNNSDTVEHQFLWKSLECINRLSNAFPSIQCSVLSNKSLAQLLAPVGAQFVKNNFISTSAVTTLQDVKLSLVHHMNWFVLHCNNVSRVRWTVYFETFNSTTCRTGRHLRRRKICTLARVRSWLNHTVKRKTERNSSSTDSSHNAQQDSGSDHSDEKDAKLIEVYNQKTQLFRTKTRPENVHSVVFTKRNFYNTVVLPDCSITSLKDEYCHPYELVFDILMQFIKFEFACRSQVQTFPTTTTLSSLSAIVFVQFEKLIAEITPVSNNVCYFVLSDLLLCITFGLCSSGLDAISTSPSPSSITTTTTSSSSSPSPSPSAFTLLRQNNLFAGLGQTFSLDQVNKNQIEATKLEASLHLLLQLVNHKVCHHETMQYLIECFFQALTHSSVFVLFTLSDNVKLVILLAELHISLGCVSSLRSHKINCPVQSRRHFRCDMTKYLFHHEYHNCVSSASCVFEHTYSTIFRISIQTINTELFYKIEPYLRSLVPCCRKLNEQLKELCTLFTSDHPNRKHYLRLAFHLCEFTIQIDHQWRKCQFCDRFAAMTTKYVELLQMSDKTVRLETIKHLSDLFESSEDSAKLMLLQDVIIPLLSESTYSYEDVYRFILYTFNQTLCIFLPDIQILLNHWPKQLSHENDNVSYLWIDYVHDLLSTNQKYLQLLVNTYQHYESILSEECFKNDILLNLIYKTNQLQSFDGLESSLRPYIERLFEYFLDKFLIFNEEKYENIILNNIISHLMIFLMNCNENNIFYNKIRKVLSNSSSTSLVKYDRINYFVEMIINLAFNASPPVIDRNRKNIKNIIHENNMKKNINQEHDDHSSVSSSNGYEPEDESSFVEIENDTTLTNDNSKNHSKINIILVKLIIWHLGGRPNVDESMNLLENIKDKFESHSKHLIPNELSIFVLEHFQTYLLNHCDSLRSLECKKLILTLFEMLSIENFNHNQVQILIELFKNNQRSLNNSKQTNTQIALLWNIELLLNCLQNIVDKLTDLQCPMFSLNFPFERSKITSNKWPSSIGKESKQSDDLVCWRAFATAFVLEPPLRMRQFSLSFWIKIHDNQILQPSRGKVHIVSLAFDALSLELWFDLSHSRYVYRLSKSDSIGRTLSSSEATIECLPNNCNIWQLIIFNVTHHYSSHTETVRVEHCANWTLQSKTVLTLSLPAGSLFNRKGLENSNKCALLLGHACSKTTLNNFYYSLGNVHLFDSHLSMISRLWLHLFGPCFAQINVLSLEQTLLPLCKNYISNNENINDLIHSFNELHRRRKQFKTKTSSSSINVCLLYDVRTPHIFWHYNNEKQVIHDSVMTFKLNSNSNTFVSSLSNSGGISVFLFMFCYLFEKLSTLSNDNCQNLMSQKSQIISQVFVSCLKLLRSLYDAHFTHRIRFEHDFNGLQVIVHAFRHHQSVNGQVYTTELLENFSMFAFETRNDQRVIFSICNTRAFLDSCTIWLQNGPETAELYFEILTSLVREANPFHAHNLTLLSECQALERLLFIIQNPNFTDQIVIPLLNVMFVVRCLIRWNLNQTPSDSTSEDSVSPLHAELVRGLLDATLALHPNDFTHIKQSKNVFFFLFPSNYCFIASEPTEETLKIELEASQFTHIATSSGSSTSSKKSSLDIQIGNDWEIVSEESYRQNFDYSHQGINSTNEIAARKINCDKILVGLLDLFVLFAQLPNDAVNEILDFLVVLVNTDSPNVRDAVLKSIFTIYNIPNENNNKNKSQANFSSTNLLRLYIVANQLNNVQCNEITFEICKQFLNPNNEAHLILSEDNIDRIVPLLGLIASQTISTDTILSSVEFLTNLTRSLTAKILFRLVNEYGFIHCLMSFLVNFNNNLHDCQSMNRSFSEIFQQITRTLLIHSSREAYECLCKIYNYLCLIENTIPKSDKSWQIIQQIRTDALRSNLTWLVAGSFSTKSLSVSFSDVRISDSNLISLNGQSLIDAYHSSLDSVVTLHSPELKPKDVLERLKFILKECSELALLSDFENNSVTHRRFGRELLLHLFELVLRSENASERSTFALLSSISSTSSSSSTFSSLPTSFLTSNCDLFKSHLTALLLHFVSPFQPMEERLFAVKALNIKSNHFKMTRSLIDRKSDSFAHLFQTFVSDIPGSDSWVEAVRKSLDIGSIKDEKFYRKQEARWLEQRELCKKDLIARTFRDNQRYFGHLSISLQPVVNDMAGRINENTLTLQHLQHMKHFKKHMDSIDQTSTQVGSALEKLISENVHEKALWYLEEHYPQHWSLSPFEAKHRVRKKLERCFLNLPNRYFIEGSNIPHGTPLFKDILSKCVSLSPVNTRLLINLPVRLVLFDDHIEGEILIKQKCVVFLSSSKTMLIWHKDLQEIVSCRYELRDTAVELYLINGLTYLFAFETTTNRDEFVTELGNNRDELPNLIEKMNLVSITPLWRNGKISNFEYLTLLNKLAGRTMNDLMQYPIFPFVLSDYTSQILNLNSLQTFRVLSRPIAVQKREREKHYIDQYNYIKAEHDRMINLSPDSFESVVTSAPYHYGSHYSNSGIVLHYLVRLPPYTQMFLHYQDANFDIADRAFHSMDTTWRLATEDSTSGFKELVPEFFYLPEFLMNQEHFNLGIRQNGEAVNHVRLPSWCRNDARLFTLIGRQALESSYVTQHLHEWIDLVFGFRQSGKAAVEAINVFHPATYFEDDLTKIQDELKRRALQTMIKTFGQMPRQLFQFHHPARKFLHEESFENQQIQPTLNGACLISPMPEVIGLRWGHYVGSPAYGKPIVNFQQSFQNTIGSIWALPTNDVFVLSTNCSLLVSYNLQRNIFLNTLYIVSYSLCHWSTSHPHVWFSKKSSKDSRQLEGLSHFVGKITFCVTSPECEYVLVALDTGLIVTLNSEDSNKCSLLIGHCSIVTSIVINKNYSIIVSGDINGNVIVWDLHKLEYIRSLNCDKFINIPKTSSKSSYDQLFNDNPENSNKTNNFINSNETKSTVSSITISDTLGDISVLCRFDEPNGVCSSLDAFTINGNKIGNVQTKCSEPFMTCVAYSTCTEGLSINVIATGFSNGTIKLWSSWDLQLYRQIRLHQMNCPVKSLCYAQQSELLFIVFTNNQLIVLENPPYSSAITTETVGGNVNNTGSMLNRSQSKRKNFRLVDLTGT